MESSFGGLAAIIVAGIAAQWVAWRTRLPSILLLLGAGVAVGQFLSPDDLFGELLMPIVSISVGIILFEGGLELRLHELREVGRSVISLVTVGVGLTWMLASVGAYTLLDFSLEASLLLGAILVVTGPTVVGPILRSIRPKGQVGAVLRWEGILNDAIGAVLAVLVFEAWHAGVFDDAPVQIVSGVVKMVFLGVFLGISAAGILVHSFKKNWVPEHLHVAITLGIIVATFTLSNYLLSESGLLTATIMGIYVANQKSVDVRHLVEFKENLRVLLLSTLFIILAARLDLDQVVGLGWGSIVFVLFLIVLVRPLIVAVCTIRSGLSRQERIFVATMAPRGIVAAAVASVFGLRMAESGIEEAESMAPVVFLVIMATVAFYGLAARPLAKTLGLARTERLGVVIVGADDLARQIALALQREGLPVLLIDLNRSHVTAAKLLGLDARYGDALSERLVEELDLSEMGSLLACTGNEHANTLAALHFSEVLGMHSVYQIATDVSEAPGLRDVSLPSHLRGNTLFGEGISYGVLDSKIRSGATVKATKLTEEFDFEAYTAEYGDTAIPLFIITDAGKPEFIRLGDIVQPQAGQKIVSMVNAEASEKALRVGSPPKIEKEREDGSNYSSNT